MAAEHLMILCVCHPRLDVLLNLAVDLTLTLLLCMGLALFLYIGLTLTFLRSGHAGVAAGFG